MVTPAERASPLAVAALVCGIVQFCGLPPARIASIVLGHRTRRKIRQTGERGCGLATGCLILGYIGLGLLVVNLAGLGIR
jgi:hypothetical protein